MKHSKTYASFNDELQNIVQYLASEQKRLEVPAAVVQNLQKDYDLWRANYEAYTDPNRQTTPVVLQTGTLYHDINDYLKQFKQNIKHDMNITLTDADYENLYIHRNKAHRGHIPIPAMAPQVDLLESHHLTNTFEITNPNPPNQNHRGRPKDVAHIGRKLALVSAGSPAPKESDYKNLVQTTRSIFQINFPPEDEGKEGYLVAWYVNHRGEAGPVSKPTTFHVN